MQFALSEAVVTMATVLITGANRGVGLNLATHFAERGDRVIATARAPQGAKALAALKERTGRVEVVPLDVTDEAATRQLATSLGSTAIDIVLCNAGIMSSRGSIEDAGHDADEWARVLATNVTGPFLAARYFLPHLKRAKAGKLAIISSIMGTSAEASGTVLAYRVSKAAVANLGLNLSAALKPMGVAVGIYHPGWVSTDMGGKSAPVTPQESAKGLVARIDHLSLASTGVFEDYRGTRFAF